MAFKYKGCFTSKRNNNFDQVETMRFTSSQYYRSLLDCRSFLHNNRIDKFMHRVFYFMHRDQLTDQTLRMLSEGYRERGYRLLTKAYNDDRDFSVKKFEIATDFRNGYRYSSDESKMSRGEHVENANEPCTCDLCKNPKAKEVVKYFNDLNKGEAIAHNCYVTKGNLSKFIKAKKLARMYFNTRLENESMYLKHGIASLRTANFVWDSIFQRTKVKFDCIDVKNTRAIVGFNKFNEPSGKGGYHDPQVLQISPTFFYKVYMKGFARYDTEINKNRVFIADVKLLKQNRNISVNPNIKLYEAVGYTAKHDKVDRKVLYTIATFETDEASGEVDMNASENKFLGQYTTPRVAISGIEKPYHELTFNEKRRLGRMIEQKIAKSNLQILNAL